MNFVVPPGGGLRWLTKWEYKVVSYNGSPDSKMERELNQLGKQGWELASVIAHGEESSCFTLVLKRPTPL
jgi:uncharacterized protein DUF4177